jgi:putative oxidoreductase
MKTLKKVKAIMTHPWLALALRLYIAGLFIYAGMVKINYTAEFAETVASYRMVPYWGVNIMAITMPWIELTVGILLACGIRVRSAIVVTGTLLVDVYGGGCGQPDLESPHRLRLLSTPWAIPSAGKHWPGT